MPDPWKLVPDTVKRHFLIFVFLWRQELIFHTGISPDILEEIGVSYENGDMIYEAYGIGGTVPFYTKFLDKIQIDTFTIKDFKWELGMLPNVFAAVFTILALLLVILLLVDYRWVIIR